MKNLQKNNKDMSNAFLDITIMSSYTKLF